MKQSSVGKQSSGAEKNKREGKPTIAPKVKYVSRIHSDGTFQGHLDRIAHAIEQCDFFLLGTYPPEEIEAAMPFVKERLKPKK